MKKAKQIVLTKLDPLVVNPGEERYLGAWCLDYALSPDALDKLDRFVLSYPVKELKDYAEIYQYLSKIEKKLFPHIVKKLNSYHRVSYSERFWRILIGYWWGGYVHSIYEKYLCLSEARKEYENTYVSIIEPEDYVIPADTRCFYQMQGSDRYNWQIFSQIIVDMQWFAPRKFRCSAGVVFKSVGIFERLKKFIKFSLMRLFRNQKKVFLLASYFSKKVLLKYVMASKTLPVYWNCCYEKKAAGVLKLGVDSLVERKNFFKCESSDSEFEGLVLSLIGLNLPMSILEDFHELERFVWRYYPSKKVRSIGTANAFAYNDGFKLFAAKQVEMFGTNYYIFQHGGLYGMCAWSFSEDYERSVSDAYINYGWLDIDKGAPLGYPKYIDRRLEKRARIKGTCLFILGSLPRFLMYVSAIPVTSFFREHLDALADVFNLLSSSLCMDIACRPYLHDYGWNDKSYLVNRLQESAHLRWVSAKENLVRQSRFYEMVVCTYNATTCLEMMMLNRPILFFWKEELWPIRDEVKPIFDLLISVSILHYSAESLVEHYYSVQDKVNRWWYSDPVQQVRRQYCDLFVKYNANYHMELADLLLMSNPLEKLTSSQ